MIKKFGMKRKNEKKVKSKLISMFTVANICMNNIRVVTPKVIETLLSNLMNLEIECKEIQKY